MAKTWLEQPMLAFDCETTGISTDSDSILTAALIHIQPQGSPRCQGEVTWINPGVPIPPETTAIHGITDEQVRERGEDPVQALEALCLVIAACLRDGMPLVGMNVPFDLTMLDRNCRRWGVQPLAARTEIFPAIDAFVLDKAVDQYRKGSRKLQALCSLYRVPLTNAHSALDDALAAARVCWRIGRMYPPVGDLSPGDLHDWQQAVKLKQDRDFAAYLCREKRDATGVDGQWPWRPPSTPALVPEEVLF